MLKLSASDLGAVVGAATYRSVFAYRQSVFAPAGGNDDQSVFAMISRSLRPKGG